MMRTAFFVAASKHIGGTAYRLAAASWSGYASLSMVAVQTMSASLTAAMLLMALAGSMYVMSIALGHLGGVLR
ncbi:hypothetical protein [Cupriavidus oxalaticus]|uniref:hypothetical protein n=1 Tax=Cupriavidus oxalaticus TaxID=96344 RepID=UPI00317FD43D